MTVKQYAQALWDALSEVSPASHDAVIHKFTEILTQDNKLDLFPDIVAELEIREAKTQVLPTEVIFATEDSVQKKILDGIHKKLGEETELKLKIDQGLIGGVVIKTGDKLLDASLTEQLRSLKNHLIQ